MALRAVEVEAAAAVAEGQQLQLHVFVGPPTFCIGLRERMRWERCTSRAFTRD